MKTKQQSETLDYFEKNAADWAKQGKINSGNKVNVIKQRNDFVLQVIKNRKRTNLALDIGCGTGDLVCEIASKGINAVGIDFAKKMIAIARNKMRILKCEKAEFKCCSIFDFPLEPNTYDVISANGFIEYISYMELRQLLKLSRKSLRPGGSLILGSRNRLFNIFSLNKFTQEEIENKNISALLFEAIRITNSKNIDDISGFRTAPLQKEGKKHKGTKVKVSTRYQFTPAQLINMLKNSGFKPVEIFPIHIHGVASKFKDKNPAIHANISNLLQNYADNNISLITKASSFMIHAKKIR